MPGAYGCLSRTRQEGRLGCYGEKTPKMGDSKMVKGRKRLVFALLAAGMALVLVEGILQLACFGIPAVGNFIFPPPQALPDDRLGSRPNPRYPEHDARGFRNAKVLDRARIVTLGDSQTYGYSVPRDAAWPRQLERLSGVSTYNLAFSGYGPVHSLLLVDEALALSPEVVVAAVYSGNDVFDAFDLVYRAEKLPELRSGDPALLARIDAANAQESLGTQIFQSWSENASDEEEDSKLSWLGTILRDHFALRALARAARRNLTRKETPVTWADLKAEAVRHPDTQYAFDSGGVRKILTPGYRLNALDRSDPRLEEGFRITVESIGRMDARLAAGRVRFLVLFIPTSELVFEEAARESPTAMPETYERLLAAEKGFWNLLSCELETRSIRFVDCLPALRECIRSSRSPYSESSDGHPSPAGHEAIARLVLEALCRDGLMRS